MRGWAPLRTMRYCLTMRALSPRLRGAGDVRRDGRARPAHAVAAPSVSPQPLPAARPGEREAPAGPEVRKDKLAAAMTFELGPAGRLIANGTIGPGTAAAFAAEIEKRGAYVKTVVLQSPGGSVQDALAMGRLIREGNSTPRSRRDTTAPPHARWCSPEGSSAAPARRRPSACTRLFAPRRLGATLADGWTTRNAFSAECQRYLREMGIDSRSGARHGDAQASLFYFKPDELLALKLATESVDANRLRPKAGFDGREPAVRARS